MTERKPYPGIKQAWGLMFILLGIAVLVYFSLYILFLAFGCDLAKKEITNPFVSNLNDFLSYTITGLLGFMVAYKKRKKSGITSMPGLKKVPPIIYIVSIVAVLCIGYVDEIVLYLVPIPDFLMELFAGMNQKSLLIFVTAVIAAPVLEELTFRGIILDGLLKNTNPGKAIIVSALIFAVIHGNPWQGVTAFIFGVFAGWLYFKTNSLVLCILLHATNNFIATLVGWLYVGDSQTPLIDKIGLANYLIGFVVMFLITIGCMRFLNNNFKKRAPQDTNIGELPV